MWLRAHVTSRDTVCAVGRGRPRQRGRVHGSVDRTRKHGKKERDSERDNLATCSSCSKVLYTRAGCAKKWHVAREGRSRAMRCQQTPLRSLAHHAAGGGGGRYADHGPCATQQQAKRKIIFRKEQCWRSRHGASRWPAGPVEGRAEKRRRTGEEKEKHTKKKIASEQMASFLPIGRGSRFSKNGCCADCPRECTSRA